MVPLPLMSPICVANLSVVGLMGPALTRTERLVISHSEEPGLVTGLVRIRDTLIADIATHSVVAAERQRRIWAITIMAMMIMPTGPAPNHRRGHGLVCSMPTPVRHRHFEQHGPMCASCSTVAHHPKIYPTVTTLPHPAQLAVPVALRPDQPMPI